MDYRLPGSPVPGILQARTLEWAAISFSNAWKWKVKVKSLSHVRLLATPSTTGYQGPPSMGFSRQGYCSGLPLDTFCSPSKLHVRRLNCEPSSKTSRINVPLHPNVRSSTTDNSQDTEATEVPISRGTDKEEEVRIYNRIFSSVQPLSHVRLFATPWIAACQASLSITNSWSSLKLMWLIFAKSNVGY